MGNELQVVVGGALAPVIKLINGSTRLLAAGDPTTPEEERERAALIVHASAASRELRFALHWHRHFSPRSAEGPMRKHAEEAGRRAYWAGLPYVALELRVPEAKTVPAIWTAFVDSWFAMRDLLCGIEAA